MSDLVTTANRETNASITVKNPSKQQAWYRSKVLTALVAVPSGFLALLLLGAFTQVPVISFGTALTPSTFRINIITAVNCAFAFLLLYFSRTLGRRIVAGVAAAALVASLTISGAMLVFTVREGVKPDLKAAFEGGGDEDLRADVEVARYARFDDKDVGMSIWLPRHATGSAPVLVYIHGGAWVIGDRFDRRDMAHAKWFAEHGYLVMSLDYSLSDKTRHLWNYQESQIGCALVWAAQHASAYGGDINRLAMIGSSAGGNLITNVASRVGNGTLKSSCGGEIPKVRAIASLYGAPSAQSVWNDSDPLVRGLLRGLLTQHLGGSPDQYPQQYAAIDSTLAVNPNTPPTLWAYGAHDHLVPPESTRRLIARLRELEVPTRVFLPPVSDHNFDQRKSLGAQAFDQVALRWFAEHDAGP